MVQGIAAAPARRGFTWYYGWNIVGLAVLSQMMTLGVATNCFSLYLLDWQRDFHAPVSTLSLAISLFSLVCAFFCAAAGWAADRFSVRWLLAIGLLIVAAVQTAIGFSNAAWQVIALYALLPLGVSIGSSIPAQALVARWFVQRRGFALGISAFGLASAAVIFPPIVVAMMHALGWRMTWWIFSGIIAFVVVPLILFGVRDRPDPNEASYYMSGGGPEVAETKPTMSYKEIVSRPNFWIVGLVFICAFCAYQGLVINLAPFVRSHGLDLATAGVLLSVVSVADLISKVVSGAAADRFGNRAPLVTLCLIGAVAAVVLAFAHAVPVLIMGLLAMGLVGAIWTLLASATAAEFGHNNFGRAFGLICTFTPFGSIAPPVLAWTQERTHSYMTGMIGLAILALIGAGLAMLLKEKKSAHHEIPAHATVSGETA